MPTAGTGNIEIYYDEVGDPGDPTLLMIPGLGSQCTNFSDELCGTFADGGLHVVRIDNRDVGLSTHLPEGAEYSLSDMAADATGVLDHLDVAAAHVFGTSMGGMVAQTVAIEHPDRARSLISVMSSTGEPDQVSPAPELLESLLAQMAPAETREAAIAQGIEQARLIGSPEMFDENWHRRRQESFYDRCYDPGGSMRQGWRS